MGFEGFDFVSPHEMFREHAQLTAHANDGRRALNLGAWANITAARIQELGAGRVADGGIARIRARPACSRDGKFLHADGKRAVPAR